MSVFYMQKNGGASGCDIPIQAETWEQAIEQVKRTVNYKITKMSPTYRNKRCINDYVELYQGKKRKELTFDDLHNPNVYRKVY